MYVAATTDILYLKGVGPTRAMMLAKELSIQTYGDTATHFPSS